MVISTIHQPNSTIFRLFDRLILMADGYIIYQGPADLAVPHFKSIGLECPLRTNPADYFLKEFYIPHERDSTIDSKLESVMDSYDIKMYPAIKEEEEAFECDKFESKIYEGSGFCRQLRYLIV